MQDLSLLLSESSQELTETDKINIYYLYKDEKFRSVEKLFNIVGNQIEKTAFANAKDYVTLAAARETVKTINYLARLLKGVHSAVIKKSPEKTLESLSKTLTEKVLAKDNTN